MHSMTQLEHRSRQPSFKGEPTASTAHRHRHPLATASLISIEAWERFSFYGMQAILVFFLYYSTTEGGIGLDKAQATALMGAYGAFLYLSTFIGGWLGDNVLGPERTLLTGAGLLVAGHGAMSFATHIPTLAVGLCLIAIGSGSLKTAAITILGAVYEQRAQVQGGLHPTTGDRIDTDRDTGFQFFYLGINIVAVAGPLLTGYLSTRYSFHVGFAAAAILMIIGVGIYLGLRRRMLAELSATTLRRISMPARPWTTTKVLGIGGAGLGALVLVVYCVAAGQLAPSSLARFLLIGTLCAALALFVGMFFSTSVTASEKRTMVGFLPIFFAACAFQSVTNQIYGVLAVYSDLRLDRNVLGFEVPAAWTQALNPAFFALMSLPIIYLWRRLGDRAPRAATKMSFGVIIAGCGLFLLIPYAGGGAHSTPYAVLAAAVFIITLGEMFIGPIGMSATTTHAPRAFLTRFSALYFLTFAIGNSLAGSLSSFYNPEDKATEISYFLWCGLGAIIIGILCFASTRFIDRLQRPH